MERVSNNKSNYKGLCINCIHRDACRHPKCEEGRIFCEEYECG